MLHDVGNNCDCDVDVTSIIVTTLNLGIWTFRSSALSFLGAKSPQTELLLMLMELSHPWNIRSSEATVPRRFLP